MDPLALFGISVAFSFAAWGVVARRYLWPWLGSLPREQALAPLLTLHAFRFIGLAFLMPGVVEPSLPAAFARPAAYGDLIAAALALLALAALRTPWGVAAVWLFNFWGAADLINAFYNGLVGVRPPPGSMGAAFFIPTSVVPLLFLTHAMMFRLLLRSRAGGSGRR